MKDLRRILSRYTEWLLKKGIIDHTTAMIDYEIEVIMANAFGNDHNDRRETREKFDSIIGQIKML